MIADVLDNSVCIFGQPVRGIAEDQVARGLQPSIPARISLDGKVMRRAVDFDYNPRFQAREVDEERTDWHLSPEFVTVELVQTQVRPELPFQAVHVTPKLSGDKRLSPGRHR